jgi:hypothetical protein
LHLAVIVAMALAGVVQVTVYQVIDVITVGDRFMAAAGAVLMALRVAATGVRGCASGGIGCGHGDLVLFDAVLAHVVHMAVVQVIDVAVVLNAGVAAAGAVLVAVIRMGSGHDRFSLCLVARQADPRRWPDFLFVGMGQRVMDQNGNVPIR